MDMKYVNYVRQRDWAYDKNKFEGLEIPDIEILKDISYGKYGKFNLLDIYYPKDNEQIYPLIINIHGGAWIAGFKEQYFNYCASLCEYGFAVLSFNYRLAPEDPYPAALNDINNLFNFVDRESEKYRIDKNNIFVIGDSAGAQLTSEYIIAKNSEEYAKKIPLEITNNIKINAVALNCGVYDIRKDIIGKDLVEYLTERVKDGIDDLKYLNSNFPPSFILTGEGDFLHDEAEPFSKLLKQHSVENVLKVYGDRENICRHDFQTDIKREISRKANADEMEFFKKHLK